MATQKKEEKLYSTEGLKSRAGVEEALTKAEYRPSQQVQDAAQELDRWQASRPAEYQSRYQEKIDETLDRLNNREEFRYHYTQDPLYRQYAQIYAQNAANASADAAAQAAALTGGYGSSYAVSAAQQAYQQQMNGLNATLPTLYQLALDTYNSGGDALAERLEQMGAQEESDRKRYSEQLADYYTQLEQKGNAYNAAYAQDYGSYQDYLNRLNSLHGYYTAQEQTEAAQKQQRFSNAMAILGALGDAAQLYFTGTAGLGSMASNLLNSGYNIYAGNRNYEAQRADAAWNQQMQERQRQDTLTQQQYKNEQAERQYQDSLSQQRFENEVTAEKLNIARGEWAMKQSQAAQKATKETESVPAETTGSIPTGTRSTGLNVGRSSLNGTVIPYEAARMRSQGRSDRAIRTELLKNGYSDAQITAILKQMNQTG